MRGNVYWQYYWHDRDSNPAMNHANQIIPILLNRNKPDGDKMKNKKVNSRDAI